MIIAEKLPQDNPQKHDEDIKELTEDLDQRTRDLNVLYTVTKAVHQSLDLNEVYRIALDTIIALDNVDMVFVYLVDEAREGAVLNAHRNVPERYIKRVSRIPRGIGITWKIIESKKLLNVEDIQNNKDVGPGGKELGHHGVLGIPITIGQEVIGVIYFATYKNRKFDYNEVSLFSCISDHLSLAISKAKLYEELRKKNKREKIISAVTRSVHMSLDVTCVLQGAADSIKNNINNADNVAVYKSRGGEAVLYGYSGNTDIYTKIYNVFVPEISSATWIILNEGTPVIDNEVSEESRYRVDFIEPGSGIRSYLGMPVRYKKRIIGAIMITSFEEIAFDIRELGFFKIVTNQIESAIENAGMAEALKESEKKYRDLYENVPAGIYCKSRDGRILMANPTLVQMLGYKTIEELASMWRSDFVVDHISDRFNEMLRKTSKITELESTWVKRDGTVINVIENVRAIRDKNGDFLYYEGTVTDITERKRVEGKLKRSREHLRKLTAHLQQYREEERTLIAREIHDEFAQLLTGMAVDLTWLKKRLPGIIYGESGAAVMEKIDNFSALVDSAFEAVKKICAKLRPKILDDLGIEAAIKWQLDTVKTQTGIEYEFTSFMGESLPDHKVSTAIFRIFQESLTNIIRHAEATEVTVNLERGENCLVLSIKDNGKGITVSSISSMDSLGLLGIRERVHALNGDIKITGVPCNGTSIKVQIPFDDESMK